MSISVALRRAIEEAIDVIRRKGVVAFPTDTLYGLGADSFCVEAVQRVFQIKGRSGDMALPILIGRIQDLEQVAVDIPDPAWPLIQHFWPGPLTLIFKATPQVPRIVRGGKDSIAVRMPNHPIPLALMRELGSPITGTSANPSGEPDPVSIEDVRRLLGDKVDYIVEGGPPVAGIPSTIVDLTQSSPRIVRPGAVRYHSLQAVCPVSLEVS